VYAMRRATFSRQRIVSNVGYGSLSRATLGTDRLPARAGQSMANVRATLGTDRLPARAQQSVKPPAQPLPPVTQKKARSQ
jgi:hypothetical protein